MANDLWSQIINLRYGPDGNVYMIDWYDANQCHHREVDIHDRGNGRIFKIVVWRVKPVRCRFARSSTDEELVDLQLHKNDWYVGTRGVSSRNAVAVQVREALRRIVRENPDPTRQLRALWALHVTSGVDDALAGELLKNKDPYVRAWTMQCLAEDHEVAPALLKTLANWLARSSPVVRLYLASAVQRLPLDQRADILSGLLAHGRRPGSQSPVALLVRRGTGGGQRLRPGDSFADENQNPPGAQIHYPTHGFRRPGREVSLSRRDGGMFLRTWRTRRSALRGLIELRRGTE